MAMNCEEKASKVRYRFNFLVKQYKKYEKKKPNGNDNFIMEREEIKNLLSLFFKEYGSFIRTRKNSFGTFDYDSYLLHLRKEESPYNSVLNLSKSSSIGDNYGELYNHHERQYKNVDSGQFENRQYKSDEFIRSNRIEYKRPYPVDPYSINQYSIDPYHYPMRHHHTDFVSGYYKTGESVPHISPPAMNRSPRIPYESTRNTQGGFYEQYVKKKVTVYDFIRNNEKERSQEPSAYDKNVYEKGAYVQDVIRSHERTPLYERTPLQGKVPLREKTLYRSPVIAPQVNNIFSAPINPPFPQYSPEFRPFRPPYGNTPLWKNQFSHMDTSKLQGRVAPNTFIGQPIRSNTYNTVKVKPIKKIMDNKKIDYHNEYKKINHKKIKLQEKIQGQSPIGPSSSTSEDYQKYFLEDLLKETGNENKMSQESTNFLYEFCDNFFEHLLIMSCALTFNNQKKSVGYKDVKMILKTEFGIKVPEEGSNVV